MWAILPIYVNALCYLYASVLWFRCIPWVVRTRQHSFGHSKSLYHVVSRTVLRYTSSPECIDEWLLSPIIEPLPLTCSRPPLFQTSTQSRHWKSRVVASFQSSLDILSSVCCETLLIYPSWNRAFPLEIKFSSELSEQNQFLSDTFQISTSTSADTTAMNVLGKLLCMEAFILILQISKKWYAKAIYGSVSEVQSKTKLSRWNIESMWS